MDLGGTGIGDFGQSGLGGPIGGIGGISGGPAGGTQATPSQQDTIAMAEQLAAMYFAFQISFPQLLPPSGTGNSNSVNGVSATGATVAFAMATEERMHQITIAVLDKWVESIAAESERRREELHSPRYIAWLEQQSPQFRAKMEREKPVDEDLAIKGSTEYQSWLNSLPVQDREDQINLDKREAILVGTMNGMESYLNQVRSGDRNAVDSLPFMTATMVVAAAGISASVPDTSSTTLVSLNMMQDTFNNNYFANFIPNDMRAELGLIGALFSVGAAYYATGAAVADAGEAQKPKGGDFAKNYAEKMIQLTSSPEFTSFLVAVMTHKTEEGQPISEQRMNQLVAIVKAVMLSVALALLYKLGGMSDKQPGTGWITDKEFAGMLNGNIELKDGTLEGSVKAALQAQLQLMSANTRVSFLTNVLDYMANNPDVDKLADIANLIAQITEQPADTPAKA